MNRMTRSALAAALTAMVALGAAAPAAVAAPKSAHVKAEHKSGKAHKHVKAKKADRLTPAQRRLGMQATRKAARLEHLAGLKKVTGLADEVRPAVLKNITDDVAELGALKTGLAGLTGKDLKEPAATLRTYRPEVYNTIVNQLRLMTRLQKEIAASADAASFTAQADALSTLVAALTTYDADTGRRDLRAAQKVLSSVKAALDEAEDKGEDAPETETPDTETPDTETPDTGSESGTTQP